MRTALSEPRREAWRGAGELPYQGLCWALEVDVPTVGWFALAPHPDRTLPLASPAMVLAWLLCRSKIPLAVAGAASK